MKWELLVSLFWYFIWQLQQICMRIATWWSHLPKDVLLDRVYISPKRLLRLLFVKEGNKVGCTPAMIAQWCNLLEPRHRLDPVKNRSGNCNEIAFMLYYGIATTPNSILKGQYLITCSRSMNKSPILSKKKSSWGLICTSAMNSIRSKIRTSKNTSL